MNVLTRIINMFLGRFELFYTFIIIIENASTSRKPTCFLWNQVLMTFWKKNKFIPNFLNEFLGWYITILLVELHHHIARKITVKNSLRKFKDFIDDIDNLMALNARVNLVSYCYRILVNMTIRSAHGIRAELIDEVIDI